MTGLWPFFTYFGGKWRAAPHYPSPKYERIIEPFAGAAGYSVRHYQRDVVLVERNPVVADLWKYLIAANESEILSIPLMRLDQTVDDLDLSAPQRTLIGFWLNKGTSSPCKSPSRWMRDGTRPKSFWGEEIRFRIASQIEAINHWTVVTGDYEEFREDEPATWFVDPPYQVAGKGYRFSSKHLDYVALGNWCRWRQGQVIVCENEGATWLPFKPFMTIKSTEGKHGKSQSREVIWTSEVDQEEKTR